MCIGITEKVKNFEIDSIFAKNLLKKTGGGGDKLSPPPTGNRVKKYVVRISEIGRAQG